MARLHALVIGVGLLGGTALAANDAQLPKGWEPCQKEIAQYCPSAATSDQIFQCIESREKLGKKQAGLSHRCYEAHEKFESPASERREHERE